MEGESGEQVGGELESVTGVKVNGDVLLLQHMLPDIRHIAGEFFMSAAYTTKLSVGTGRSHAHSGLTPTHRHLACVLPVPSAGVAMAIMVRQRHLSNVLG